MGSVFPVFILRAEDVFLYSLKVIFYHSRISESRQRDSACAATVGKCDDERSGPNMLDHFLFFFFRSVSQVLLLFLWSNTL